MRKQSIIIVDDSAPLRDRIKEVVATLENFHMVSEADNGLDAIRLIKLHQPDFVTLDISMPKKTGLEVLKAIEPLKYNISVVVITNHADQLYMGKCMKLGASHFLDKSKEFQLLKGILSA